jgi:hypothetical protein
MNDLVLTYIHVGLIKEFVDLQEERVKIDETAMGLEHPDTLRSMAVLASGYLAVGRISEGEELQRKVVEATRNSLGDEHPSLYAEREWTCITTQ